MTFCTNCNQACGVIRVNHGPADPYRLDEDSFSDGSDCCEAEYVSVPGADNEEVTEGEPEKSLDSAQHPA